MSKVKFTWIIGLMFCSLFLTKPGWGLVDQGNNIPTNSWTVFLDDFSDYTAVYPYTSTTCPLYPFWLNSNATNSTVFLTANTATARFQSIAQCLVVASNSDMQEVVYHHDTRLANYSFQYFTRVPYPGGLSEGLIRYNIDTGGNEYGYSVVIGVAASTTTPTGLLGKVKLSRVVAGTYQLLTTTLFSVNSTITNDTTINPFDWFFVKADISNYNIQISLDTNTNPVMIYNDSGPTTIPTGGVGFRARNFGAFYYYPRVDVSVLGAWKILYGAAYNTKYVDINTTYGSGNTLVTASQISQLTTSLSGVTACAISSMCPTPFGDHIVYMISTPSTPPTYGCAFFALSSSDGSNLHVILNPVSNQSTYPTNFQELESVGVDGFAYIDYRGNSARLSLPDYGLGTVTLIPNNPGGPTISPDGSFLSSGNYRKDTSSSSYYGYFTVYRVGSSVFYLVNDEWLYNADGINQGDVAMDTTFTAVSSNFYFPSNWAGFGNWYQTWDWGMKGFFFPEYGPNDSAPQYIGNNSLWYWDPHNGYFIQYKNLQDNQSPTPNPYPGYWDCPSPDPRGNNQFMASYQSPDSTGYPGYWHNSIRWIDKSTQKVQIAPITSEYDANGNPNGNGDPWGAIFWNKPD